MKQLLYVAVLSVVASIAGAQSPRASAWPRGEMQSVSYVRAVDGDTIIVKLPDAKRQTRVRLFAVDCPELRTGTRAAFMSAAFTAETLEQAQSVFIELDTEAGAEDTYDRTLAWVWFFTADCTDGPRLLNLELYEAGRATIDTRGKCSHRYDAELGVAAQPP